MASSSSLRLPASYRFSDLAANEEAVEACRNKKNKLLEWVLENRQSPSPHNEIKQEYIVEMEEQYLKMGIGYKRPPRGYVPKLNKEAKVL